MAEFELSYEYIQRAANHPDVVKQLQVVADRVRARAEGLAASEGVEMTLTTKAGVRPSGRPYVNVEGDNADQEFGTSRTKRFRILGRAGEQG